MHEVGKKYNERTLRRIRQFYDVFKKEKWSTMWTKLCWSHYGEGIIEKYSQKLSSEVNKKYNKTNLKRMRQFYIMIEKGALIGHQFRKKYYELL